MSTPHNLSSANPCRIVKIVMTRASLGEPIALRENERIVGIKATSEPWGIDLDVFVERPAEVPDAR